MEKRSPHYPLVRVQFLVNELGARAFTKSAMDGGRALGLTTSEMLGVFAALTTQNFYKSMTTYADHTIWQDVYICQTIQRREVYLKLTMRDQKPVIQFKEK